MNGSVKSDCRRKRAQLIEPGESRTGNVFGDRVLPGQQDHRQRHEAQAADDCALIASPRSVDAAGTVMPLPMAGSGRRGNGREAAGCLRMRGLPLLQLGPRAWTSFGGTAVAMIQTG